MTPKTLRILGPSCILVLGAFAPRILAQAEANVWGGLRGIRVDGELMSVTSGLRALNPDATLANPGGRERLGNPQFSHEGPRQISSGGLVAGVALAPGGPAGGRGRGVPNRVNGQVTYEDAGPGLVKVEAQVTATADTPLAGVYYVLHLTGEDYADGSARLIEPEPNAATSAATTGTAPKNQFPRGMAKGVRLASPRRQLEVLFAAPTDISVQPTRDGTAALGIDVHFPICAGNLVANQVARLSFTLKASGDVDRSPARLIVDPAHPGRPFEGVGGNFRLQSPLDPPQVTFNLENLRVARARVNLPLDRWQPQENDDPVAAAEAGRLDNSVRQAFEMERTLAQRNIPMMISVWSLPNWARTPVTPRPPDSGGPGMGSTYHLNAEKWDAVCKSIGAYLDYAKQHYGVQPVLFSFNETDIGYDVLQTPQEHTEAIKRLGAFFAARGLPIKLVLGDTGDPTGFGFIDDAMADPAAVRYLGAISFHSWRGGTAEQFSRWGAAAQKLNLPVLVGEGGMDSDAYRYQALLLEPWYALVEIGEYIDICRLTQPLTILQWQLTENYSLLTGGRNGQPLAPAQRFWQLKQLGSTPAGARAVPVTCDKSAIVPCAFVDPVRGTIAVHLINNGATRPATVAGFAPTVKALRVVVTDFRRGMNEEARVKVVDGSATLTLDSMSYTTVTSAE